MSVIYDKSRKRYRVQYNRHGKRYYGGRHRLKRDALAEEKKIKAKLAKLDTLNIETYELGGFETGRKRKLRLSEWFKKHGGASLLQRIKNKFKK